MTSEPAHPAESGASPDLAAPTPLAARLRAESDRLRDEAATAAVVERAKGALMALTGCGPDTAGEELRRRARAAGRTLAEECRLTLGARIPRERPPATALAPSPHAPGPGVPVTAPAGDGFALLGRLGEALARVSTPQELARCLLEHLAPDTDTAAVLLFRGQPAGGLVLVGHAGVDEALAARWCRVPPRSGVVALDALRAGEPRWLEDADADRERCPLAGDPSGPRRSRAWLPVPADDTAEFCIGVLRAHDGPFTPPVRHLLRAVSRLCAGRLRAFGTGERQPAGEVAVATRAVFGSLPGVAMLLTPLRTPHGEVQDYRIDAATSTAIEVVGPGGGELVGRGILECFPAMAGEELWQGCLRTLATGEPYEGEPFAHQEPAAGAVDLSTYSVCAARLGGGLVVTWIRRESSDRQERRLADVQRLGNLGWVNWNLLTHEADWSSQVFDIFDRDPARGPVPLTDLPGHALPEDAPSLARGVREIVRGGRPFDVPFRIGAGDGIRHLRAVMEAVSDVDGTPVEVHGFVQDVTALRSAELALVQSEQEILTQHGVLRAERTVAARLQHALLPLPTRALGLAGLRVEVVYLPAQSGLHVGGDWFSAIELSDDDALFVVGDVAGHGIGAVATMAQLRFTAKGMVITGSSLTGALTRLNTLLLHSRDSHATATMVLARYHAGDGRLEWAQAGHPPPLLLRDGEARQLARPRGMLLGASHSPVFEGAECHLRPGDRLLLYTDGLVERPGESIDRGLERLAGAVRAHHAHGTGSLALLLAEVLEGEPRDDVCVLDIRVPATPG